MFWCSIQQPVLLMDGLRLRADPAEGPEKELEVAMTGLG